MQSVVTGSVTLREHLDPKVAELVFRDTDYITLMRNMGRWKTLAGGGTPYQWLLNYAGNTSGEVYTEGQSYGTTGRQSYVRCSIDPFYYRIRFGRTGHMRDQQRLSGVVTDDKAELMGATADLFRGLEAQFLGSTANRGIASVIDANDTYANVAPGTITAHAALETAIGGALSFGNMETCYETLIGNPRNAKPAKILTRENQINNYLSLIGPGAGTSNVMRFTVDGTAKGVIDYGLLKSVPAYNGATFELVRDLLNSEMYWIDPGNNPEDFCIMEVRPPTVKDDPSPNDDEQQTMSWAGFPVVKYRRRQAVLRTLTA